MPSLITTLTAIAIACLAAAAMGPVLAADPQPIAGFDVTEIAPGNYVHYGSFDERSAENLGDNANIGFIVGERCVLAVDAGGSLPVGHALRQAIPRGPPPPGCHCGLEPMQPRHI